MRLRQAGPATELRVRRFTSTVKSICDCPRIIRMIRVQSRNSVGVAVRLSFLDSIRGIAALIVLTSHLPFTAGREIWFFDLRGFRILNQSVFAVSIFFVLSGLVLFLQLDGTRINFVQFIVRRFFRIFPACIFAVTVSYLIYLLWTPQPLVSRGDWFNDVSWPPGISPSSYLHHLLLDGADALLRPIWSLVIEWRVSLVFPAIMILFTWSSRLVGCVAVATAFVIAISPKSLITQGLSGIPGAYFYAAFFSTFFIAGIFIAAYRLKLVLFFRRRPLARYILLVLCSYYLFLRSGGDDLIGYMKWGFIGCALIIFCMSDSKARRFLRSRSLRYMGRISYSLYLVHMIWIGLLFRLLEGTDPLVISAIVIAASILSADLVHRFVEVPANKFGRQLAGMITWPTIYPPPPAQKPLPTIAEK
jgi:peptidoglycan/LPS O-acetylase OafA/YrhL